MTKYICKECSGVGSRWPIAQDGTKIFPDCKECNGTGYKEFEINKRDLCIYPEGLEADRANKAQLQGLCLTLWLKWRIKGFGPLLTKVLQ